MEDQKITTIAVYEKEAAALKRLLPEYRTDAIRMERLLRLIEIEARATHSGADIPLVVNVSEEVKS